MPKYVLGHHLKGEGARLELMSELPKLDEALVDRFLAHCSDSNWWTQTIAFTAVHGRTLAG
jgi:hypothetical protein